MSLQKEKLKEELSEIDYHIWQQLFDLIPIIESKTNFGRVIKTEYSISVEYDDIVNKFLEFVWNYLLVENAFDDSDRLIGLIRDEGYEALTLSDICKDLTIMVVTERHSAGSIYMFFNDGLALKCLTLIQRKVEMKCFD